MSPLSRAGFGHFVRGRCSPLGRLGSASDPWARKATVAPGRVVADTTGVDGAFDVITLWDVLEHTTEPVELLAGLRTHLRPGGRVFVCSPNFNAMTLRWPILRHSSRRFNELVQPNEHAIQFTDRGTRLTLERAGYERVELLRPPLASRSNPVLDALARSFPSLRKGLFANAYAPRA